MTTSPAKGNTGTIAIIGVLTVVLLIGSGLFIYFALQLFRGGPAAQPQTAMATPEHTQAPAASETEIPTLTPTRTRTPVVIVAATAIPDTPSPTPTAERATETPATNSFATATPTSKASPAPVASTGGEDGELPQTGLGLGTPVFGLLLAGVAGAARWLRRRE